MFERVKRKFGIHRHRWYYTDKVPEAITPRSERYYYYVMDCEVEGCCKELYVLGYPTQAMLDDFKERKKKK